MTPLGPEGAKSNGWSCAQPPKSNRKLDQRRNMLRESLGSASNAKASGEGMSAAAAMRIGFRVRSTDKSVTCAKRGLFESGEVTG